MGGMVASALPRRIFVLSSVALASACREPPKPPPERVVVVASTPAPVPTKTPAVRPPPPKQGPCPGEMAQVGLVCIDRWEARLFEGEAAHAHNQRPKDGVRYTARSSASVFPQAYINRLEAAAACEASEKRLCTLGEWYDACRGKKRRTFPYGVAEKKGVCNAGKPHLLAKVFGTRPEKWTYAAFNDPMLNLEPGFLSKTAEHAECASDYDVFDQVGNVHEWVSDVVGPSLEQKLPLRDDIRDKLEKNAGKGIFMGGFYSTTNEHGEGCGFVTIGHEPKYHDYSTGFRCCKNVQSR